MAVRWRKYFKECKPVNCGGKRSKQCPPDLPHKVNGEHKACGVWLVEMFDESKQWVSLSFPDVKSRRDAERRLSILIADRERGMLNLPKQRKIPVLTEYSKKYLSLYSQARENTRLSKIRAIKVINQFLGSYRLDKVTPFLVEKFRISRKEGGVNVGSINLDVQILKHLLNEAKTDGLITTNPCDGIKKFKTVSRRDRVLTSDEIALLLDTLPSKERMMFLVSLFTGARLGEVLVAKWQDINFANSIIHIYQSKTGKILATPLSSYLADQLKKYKAEHEAEFLFEDRKITANIVCEYSKNLSGLFRQILGFPFTFHQVRHCFGSLIGNLGSGASTIQSLLGHADLSMTSRYVHEDMISKHRAIESLTNYIQRGAKTIECTSIQKAG